MVNAGEWHSIKKVGGGEDIKKFLNNLGFVIGCPIAVVNKIGENVIVSIKESRVAISREMAMKIMV
jgi:ferrous iron transport protein A